MFEVGIMVAISSNITIMRNTFDNVQVRFVRFKMGRIFDLNLVMDCEKQLFVPEVTQSYLNGLNALTFKTEGELMVLRPQSVPVSD